MNLSESFGNEPIKEISRQKETLLSPFVTNTYASQSVYNPCAHKLQSLSPHAHSPQGSPVSHAW